jgi:hypothetical protein
MSTAQVIRDYCAVLAWPIVAFSVAFLYRGLDCGQGAVPLEQTRIPYPLLQPSACKLILLCCKLQTYRQIEMGGPCGVWAISCPRAAAGSGRDCLRGNHDDSGWGNSEHCRTPGRRPLRDGRLGGATIASFLPRSLGPHHSLRSIAIHRLLVST